MNENIQDMNLIQTKEEIEHLEPVLMSQFFVCSSSKQRMSMAKFMIEKDKSLTPGATRHKSYDSSNVLPFSSLKKARTLRTSSNF